MNMAKSGSMVFSTYLSTRENGLLVSLIGADCSTLASAVVQLVLDCPDQKGQRSGWKNHGCGVVCLVQDQSVHSAFIRLYSVKKAKLLWEQEVYTPFSYSARCPYFHSFAGDDCNAGLNFTDEEEAEKFLSAVQTYIGGCTAERQVLKTHSQDSASGRLLWEQLSPSDFRPSPASPESKGECTFPEDVSTDKLSPKNATAALSKSSQSSPRVLPKPKKPASTSQDVPTRRRSVKKKPSLSKSSQNPPTTLPKPKKESLPLAIRKGPLPPLPVQAKEASVGASSGRRADSLVLGSLCVPPPPSYPAPKAPCSVSEVHSTTGSRSLTGLDVFSMVKRPNSYAGVH